MVTELRQAGDQSIIYKDSHCCSSESERPLLLVPGRETRELTGEIMKLLDEGVKKLCQGTLRLAVPGLSGPVLVKVQAHVNQLDGKSISTLTGLGGAYCTCCHVSAAEGKSLDRVRQGFKIERTASGLNEQYQVKKARH